MEALQFEADIQIWEGLTVLLQAVAGGVDVNSATCTYADVSRTLGPRQLNWLVRNTASPVAMCNL